jgi:GntR family transcriptional regulator
MGWLADEGWPVPLKYEQIAEWLRDRINDGTYPPGSKLPGSRDLSEQWGTSRETVVRALDLLKEDALIVSRQGSGYWVVENAIGRPAGARHAGSTRVKSGMPFRRLGQPTRETPPRHIAQALGVPEGAQALRRARLMLDEDGQPHSHVVAWFPLDIADACRKLNGEQAIPEGTTAYIARCTGRSPAVGADDEAVRLLRDEEARLLGVTMPAACHVMLHVAVDERGAVLVVEEGVTPQGMWGRSSKYAMITRS